MFVVRENGRAVERLVRDRYVGTNADDLRELIGNEIKAELLFVATCTKCRLRVTDDEEKDENEVANKGTRTGK